MRATTAPRPLGRSALRAFPIAHGCWRFAGTPLRDARAKIDAALDAGITLFDHADIYGGDGAAESLFGAALAEAPRLRERVLIATKCGIVKQLERAPLS
jgi:aryl-alcohol dehydrogenase-like predicted oxidoreductase